MILLIGSSADPHVQAVQSRLIEANSTPILLDIFQSQSAGLVHNLSAGINLSLGEQKIDLSNSTAIWWRQKAKPQYPSGSAVDMYNYNFVQREWNTIFDYIAGKTVGSFSINDRTKAKYAENKAFQLELASKFAFNIPKTIITNNFKDAETFFRREGVERCVYKTFSPYMPPDGKITYTTELDFDEIAKGQFKDTHDTTPGIFQELIEPAYELRVTVVGDELFCARIDAPAEEVGIDWRTSLFRNKYSEFEMPKNVQIEILRYHANLGLVFAAYDFIVSTNQELFLLEVNPSGQWMWLEQQLGFPISNAIAKKLRTCC